MSTENLDQPQAPVSPLVANSRYRLITVIVIVGAIVGIALLIGNRQGWDSIGQGGVNARLLPEVGEPAPEIVTFDTSGNIVRLSDFQGQPVWLNFWGSWCPPCRAEFPEIQAAYEDLNAQGLVMLGIAVREDPLVAQDYADRVGGTFPVLADPGWLASVIPENQPEALAAARQMATSYTINNFPTHIFIDRDGTVASVAISPLTYEDAMAFGEAALASPQPTDVPPQFSGTPPATMIRSRED